MTVPLRDSAIRLSADVGGTFTDVAAFDEATGALKLGKTLTTPQRLVTGLEIQRMLGIRPGPEVGRALAAIRRAQVEGLVRSREDAAALIARLAARG